MTDQDTERELIAKVAENPADDVPRLAYANWLETQGREARARLIRVQCQLEHLKAEEKTLIQQYGSEWGEELLAQRVKEWTFRRGFPEDFKIGIRDFLDHHAKIAEITPIVRITLPNVIETDEALIDRFAKLSTIKNLQALDVGDGDGRFGPAGILALTKSPYLKNLEELSLHSSRIGLDGVRHVIGAPFIKNLTKLVIHDPNLEREKGLLEETSKSLNPNIIKTFRMGDITSNWAAFVAYKSNLPADERGMGTSR